MLLVSYCLLRAAHCFLLTPGCLLRTTAHCSPLTAHYFILLTTATRRTSYCCVHLPPRATLLWSASTSATHATHSPSPLLPRGTSPREARVRLGVRTLPAGTWPRGETLGRGPPSRKSRHLPRRQGVGCPLGALLAECPACGARSHTGCALVPYYSLSHFYSARSALSPSALGPAPEPRSPKRPRTRSRTVQAGGLWLRYRRTQPGAEYGITRGRGREDVPDMLGG